MTKKKSEKSKGKGLLSEILKDTRDKEIDELRKENEQLQDKVGYWMNQAAREEANAKQNWEKYRESLDVRNSEVASLQRSHQEDFQACSNQLKKRDEEIDNLRTRLKNYSTWVQRILQCDFQIQPAEVALSKIAFVLEILRASLAGETLEGAMQRLGYLETVFGFENEPVKRKPTLRIQKTEGLYKHDEGVAKMLNPTSTQIYAIKELRQHLGIGLKDAKDITDTLYEERPYEIEFSSREDAEKAMGALRRCGYFSLAVIER
jgi:hypothetical protein